jgi:sucrose-6F-phosphate phosphohydrolase
MLVCDIDGTILGHDQALGEFRDWVRQRSEYVDLVYNSGRTFTSILGLLRQSKLPRPAAVIAMVGTEIYVGRSLAAVHEWPVTLGCWDALRIRRALETQKLELQADEFQSDLKVSYHAWGMTPDCLDNIVDVLRNHGCEVNLTYSSNRDLDLLPSGVDKGSATYFLSQSLGFSPDQVIVVGDSGNDVSMFNYGFSAVAVGNADVEVKNHSYQKLFVSSRSHAAGVLQGIEYWLRRRYPAIHPLNFGQVQLP